MKQNFYINLFYHKINLIIIKEIIKLFLFHLFIHFFELHRLFVLKK